MKRFFILILIFILLTALCGCGSAEEFLSVSSSVADKVISKVRSMTDPEDAGGMDGESVFDPVEEPASSDNPETPSEPDELSMPKGSDESDDSAPFEKNDLSEPENLPGNESTDDTGSENIAMKLKKLLNEGTATIGDLKAMNLSSLKSSPSLLIDVFLNKNIQKNNYNNRLFRHEGSLLYYDDPEYNCLLGVDVSFFQGEIDWEAVKAQGISFVFVRIGFRGYGETGSLNEDPMFRQNLEGARQAGLLIGGYFFSQAANESEAMEEAEYALFLLDGFSLDLPLVFDAEFIKEDDTRLDGVLLSQFTQNALIFCQTVEAAGYEAMIYSNLLWEGLIYDLEELSDYPLWYADYNAMPLTPYHFDFWQYTESGRLDGIEEPVDISIWMRKQNTSE